ncbi:flagellar hook-associated protein FlgK [Brevundimonas sp. 2R-24]|uniref:Flagellar hook-associated protein 1 n=1 Tax=Peiella sedimenti TaxID=3061083 RepID=A0ABT8SLK6_9CAUL|nr:flagellar hook-associated protein FlgK [Caulobacteraceae bacterium XZ-24]
MSLSLILNTATSGLHTAQTQLRVVSDNVANVNTPGYVRKIADQVAVSSQGIGAGVDVARVRLATDRFLQAASLTAGSESGRQTVRAQLFDRIQAMFGDPGSSSGFFAQIDSMFAAFSAIAEDPVSTPLRQDVLFRIQGLFDESARISGQIQDIRQDADGRIQSAVERVNDLLSQIEALNTEIARANVTGSDATGAESTQAALIASLAEFMDIRTSVRPVGGVSIRTNAGLLLAGDGAASLSYQRAGAVNAETQFGELWITEPRGEKRALLDTLSSGQLKGLVELRDVEAPAAAERLAELMTRMADELNRGHNAATATPPPSSLTGRNTGMTLETALQGFTGSTSIVATSASGAIVGRADVVFGPPLTVGGTPSSAATFLADVNAQLGGTATLAFSNGVLSLTGAGSNGVAVADPAGAASDKAGRGFSHFFGLNDLVRADRLSLYDTGLSAASAHGFSTGETVAFRFRNAGGARVRDLTFTIPAGVATVGQLVTALNDPASGVGRFGTFSLGANGALSFTANAGSGVSMSVLEDRTTQVPSGVSFTELFGVGQGVRASRADAFSVRADILASPRLLAAGQLDLTAAAGVPAVASGDGRGALKLADAGQRAAAFQAAGGSAANQISVSRYAAEFSGHLGGQAAAAEDRRAAAEALHDEAVNRQLSQEGVNLDEELVKLTTYQQAFAASARLIQTAGDLYDVLLGMMR